MALVLIISPPLMSLVWLGRFGICGGGRSQRWGIRDGVQLKDILLNL